MFMICFLDFHSRLLPHHSQKACFLNLKEQFVFLVNTFHWSNISGEAAGKAAALQPTALSPDPPLRGHRRAAADVAASRGGPNRGRRRGGPGETRSKAWSLHHRAQRGAFGGLGMAPVTSDDCSECEVAGVTSVSAPDGNIWNTYRIRPGKAE